MVVQGNLLIYVDVVRHIEKLGGSKGHVNDEEAFIKALKQGLSVHFRFPVGSAGLLLTRQTRRSCFRRTTSTAFSPSASHAAAILKHAANPRETGTAENEMAGRQGQITFQDWLVGLEALGGSKGFEDFLKENPTGLEPVAVSEAEHKEKDVGCSLWNAAFYNIFRARTQGKVFQGSKWSLSVAEVPYTIGEISYNNGMFERTKRATVRISGLGLVADYYNNQGWAGQLKEGT
ncbi:hypothetical protein B0H14DRAFT_2576333 [Mycena olivaceomarginata]|nr:hypothetical protein B0H14DRAFT_2576333 [Mycena olivaceomarginata]